VCGDFVGRGREVRFFDEEAGQLRGWRRRCGNEGAFGDEVAAGVERVCAQGGVLMCID